MMWMNHWRISNDPLKFKNVDGDSSQSNASFLERIYLYICRKQKKHERLFLYNYIR